jgi:hypothetical protein
MASKHKLEGLISWSTRERWADQFKMVLEDHVIDACDETGTDLDEIVSTIGDDLFMGTVWACAFEDFLTREFDDGGNMIDDYLKRRGWKESAATRNYMSGLRHSAMSLYEVSDVVRGVSFRARDLILGGEPVLISERSATQSLKPWERIAARIIQVGSQMQIGGGLLPFDHETSEILIESFRKFDSLSSEEKRAFAEENGYDVDDDLFSDISPADRLRASAPLFTTFWLVDAIDRIKTPRLPELRNSEGDELMLCKALYPLSASTTPDDISAVLQRRPEFRPTSATSWSWVGGEKDAAGPATAASDHGELSQQPLAFETWSQEGELVIGDIRLEDRKLVLSVNSTQRFERGCALLSELFGKRLRKPKKSTKSIEEMLASEDSGAPNELDIPEGEKRAIVHQYLDRHYREVLDQPVPMLDGETPRAAVKTESGKVKVVEWLKQMENRTAEAADKDSPMADYNFGWLWTELGVSDRRR